MNCLQRLLSSLNHFLGMGRIDLSRTALRFQKSIKSYVLLESNTNKIGSFCRPAKPSTPVRFRPPSPTPQGCSPTGRGTALRTPSVRVRLPPSLPLSNGPSRVITVGWRNWKRGSLLRRRLWVRVPPRQPMRASSNGKTRGFQPRDGGSNPPARSTGAVAERPIAPHR